MTCGEERKERDPMRGGTECDAARDGRRAYTLVEAMVVLVVMAIVVSMGIPQFSRSLEQSRADVAAANLRAIWAVERIYWLQNRQYIGLNALAADPTFSMMLDRSITGPGPNASYIYSVEPTESGFTATASRQGGGWRGELTIDAQGVLGGQIVDSTASQFVTVNP
jgi:prepilin-type N-terminal cleavage/methylation domain-containing protein